MYRYSTAVDVGRYSPGPMYRVTKAQKQKLVKIHAFVCTVSRTLFPDEAESCDRARALCDVDGLVSERIVPFLVELKSKLQMLPRKGQTPHQKNDTSGSLTRQSSSVRKCDTYSSLIQTENCEATLWGILLEQVK